MLHVRQGRGLPVGAVRRAHPLRGEPSRRPRLPRREAVLLPPDAPHERGADRRGRPLRLRRDLFTRTAFRRVAGSWGSLVSYQVGVLATPVQIRPGPFVPLPRAETFATAIGRGPSFRIDRSPARLPVLKTPTSPIPAARR